jgi:hypothetical protein
VNRPVGAEATNLRNASQSVAVLATAAEAVGSPVNASVSVRNASVTAVRLASMLLLIVSANCGYSLSADKLPLRLSTFLLNEPVADSTSRVWRCAAAELSFCRCSVATARTPTSSPLSVAVSTAAPIFVRSDRLSNALPSPMGYLPHRPVPIVLSAGHRPE